LLLHLEVCTIKILWGLYGIKNEKYRAYYVIYLTGNWWWLGP